ncbi:hypothetical protein C2845_PM09G22860 [Panicum miliaceum]|uniref:KIB1-4 beta-propeller domain-containing protein n=1 Tax=Panicum miliaceum TaxID=4540 RepID=A0A3L6RZ36_PANMI|nr:hypothetical protein C2845_PM09G22860 [Panicum miliaceum]
MRTPSPAIDCLIAIQCVTLSAAPSRDDAYVAAAITSGPANVAFWRPGAERWCPPVLLGQTEEKLGQWRRLLPRDPVEDLLFFRGRLHQGFYALDIEEQLVVYIPDTAGDDANSHDMLTVRVIRYTIQMDAATSDHVVLSRYLVESRGDLLMARYLGPQGFDVFSLQGEQSVVAGRVHATWRRCPYPTGRALFLGRGCSMAVESGAGSHLLMHSLADDESWFYP